MHYRHSTFPSDAAQKRGRVQEVEGTDHVHNVRRRKLSHYEDAQAEALFHPLPDDLNRHTLAVLGYLPAHTLTDPGGSDFTYSPSSIVSELEPSLYGPDRAPFTGPCDVNSSLTSTALQAHFDYSSSAPVLHGSEPQRRPVQLLQPESSAVGSTADNMQVDGQIDGPQHGPACKSIPQLSVRFVAGAVTELWATCVDCGAASKVQDSTPSTTQLCYSP